jgi:hypothetical protein
MSETDNITDTNTEPTIELETETMVIELSCVNEAGIAGSDIPPVDPTFGSEPNSALYGDSEMFFITSRLMLA